LKDRVLKFQTKGESISVNIPDWDSLNAAINHRFEAGKGFALATLNLDHLVKLASDQSFGNAYQAQDFVVADGNPIVWLSRLAKQPVSLLPGSELVVPLAQIAASRSLPIALIGSTSDALERAAANLKSQIPGLEIISQIAPPFGFDPQSAAADDVLDQVAASGAKLCFLALGAPKQEILAARGRMRAPTLAFASIGAGLDFLAGTQNRAPKWVQRFALEWLWRLLRSPSRLFVRYLSCFAILPSLTFDAYLQRRKQKSRGRSS
jgi:N-acetylglucosaminyldiphosphoundecaprenol N-acetyl-beta-D-mannosaminyltransferase